MRSIAWRAPRGVTSVVETTGGSIKLRRNEVAFIAGLKKAASDSPGMMTKDTLRRLNPDPRKYQIFEPMGLALENFDAVGSWRTLDEGQPIDASGVLPDGTKVAGVVDLRKRLRDAYSDQFVEVVAEKLLTYAVGRGTEYQDMPMIRAISRDAAKNGYHFSALVMSIVKSDMFRMNQKAATTSTARAAN